MSFAMTFTTIIHVLLCVFMIFVILLQPGKDAGMGSALGGGAASSAFGGQGAVTVLGKITGVFAALFFLTSLGLSFVGFTSSVAEGAAPPAAEAPASPAGDTGVNTVEQPTGATPAAPAEGAAPAAPTDTAAPTEAVPPPIEGGGNPAQ